MLQRARQARRRGLRRRHRVRARGRAAARGRSAPRPLIVTPGIRPADGDAAADDQRRVVTPTLAFRSGADHIVVGRPDSRRRRSVSQPPRQFKTRLPACLDERPARPYQPAPDPGLARRLRRMRAFATALLVAMAVVYVGTTWFAEPDALRSTRCARSPRPRSSAASPTGSP